MGKERFYRVCPHCGSVEIDEIRWSPFGKDLVCRTCLRLVECVSYDAGRWVRAIWEMVTANRK